MNWTAGSVPSSKLCRGFFSQPANPITSAAAASPSASWRAIAGGRLAEEGEIAQMASPLPTPSPSLPPSPGQSIQVDDHRRDHHCRFAAGRGRRARATSKCGDLSSIWKMDCRRRRRKPPPPLPPPRSLGLSRAFSSPLAAKLDFGYHRRQISPCTKIQEPVSAQQPVSLFSVNLQIRPGLLRSAGAEGNCAAPERNSL